MNFQLYVNNKHWWPIHHESISTKNFIGLKPRIFSPANLSTSTVYHYSSASNSLETEGSLKLFQQCAKCGHPPLSTFWSQYVSFVKVSIWVSTFTLTGLMIMASHRIVSGQIKHMCGQIKIGQTNLSMEVLLSLQKKINVQTIFSPYNKHCLHEFLNSKAFPCLYYT